ncbi:MAG: RluA family pseudouridine synthase [Burkholderiaceae bacterium]|nr:RluA family pseudouridine synthase [Burkholderiaceae bacterium]
MLPTKNGVGPSVVGLPKDELAQWRTITDFLVDRFPAIPRATWLQRIADGDVEDEFGVAVTPERPYQGHIRVYYYRDLEVEPRIPFDEVILHQDEHLIVVDKPHFLPVTPSGKYLQETVLVRLKRKLGLDTLVPIHRIDRDTAGLVLFSVQSATRDAYQALFRDRAVKKTYEAIAPWRPALFDTSSFPLTRHSRIVEGAGFMTQREVEGPPNALTHIQLLEIKGQFARYQLSPVTGKRHQLRVHMNALGLPIVGDGIYPVLTPEGQIDYDHPLQLLAKSIEWLDPITQEVRRFESRRELKLL